MDQLKASHMGDHVGYWLRYVSNQVSQSFARKLDAKGVTVAEWVVIRELYEGRGIAPSRLAQELGLTRGAISKLSDRLVAKGLVRRDDHPEDGRAHSLTLTEAGCDLVPDIAAIADQNDAEFFGHLGTAQRDMMTTVLRDIVRRSGMKKMPLH